MISAIVESDQFQKTAPAPATPAHAKPLQAANHH
jgi:hypothetical protein